jgi:hypothetical protein
MPSPGFVQMFQLMLQMAGQRQQREQAERGFSMEEKKLDTLLKQYEEQHKDKHTTDLLSRFAKAASEERTALIELEGTGRFGQQEMNAFRRIAAAMPIDPAVLGAQDVQAGFARRTPEVAAVAQQEAANRASTGMNMGQMGMSQLMGAMATGAPPPGQLGQVIPQQQWGNQIQNFVARAAQGYTPEQMATQQGQLQLGYDQLDAQAKQYLAQMGLEKDKIQNAGQKGFSTSDMVSIWQGAGKLLEDINSPRSDEAGNMARKRALGVAALWLGLPINYFAQQPPAGIGPNPTPSTPYRQYWQNQPGFAPGMGGPMSGIPRF